LPAMHKARVKSAASQWMNGWMDGWMDGWMAVSEFGPS
jgi:hypothetical protein